MKVRQLENAVWATETIRIVIRASSGSEVGEYDYVNAATYSWTVSELIENRIRPLVGNAEIVAIRGNGHVTRGNVVLQTLKDSYH